MMPTVFSSCCLLLLLLAGNADAFSSMPPQTHHGECAEPRTTNALKELRAGPSLPMTDDEQYFNGYISGPKLAAEFGGVPGFYHGVASGSPTQNSLIIWTRFTPSEPDARVEVSFMMAEGDDPAALSSPAALTGKVWVEPGHDWIAKIDVTGLKAGSKYQYVFTAAGKTSPIGHGKTAPPPGWMGSLTYAVFSCSRWENGWFHAYDVAAHVKDLDLWVHTGDYLYEYGGNLFRGTNQIQPPWEIVTLTDYRRRHALYAEDKGLQKLRSSVSMIAQWDDHEFTNNPYGRGMGADNHQPICTGNRTNPAAQCSTDEGIFLERANRAAQAYFEWLPLRRGPRSTQGQIDTDLTVVVEWGDVATFLLQDTRIEARPAHGTLGLQEPDFALSMFTILLGAAASLNSDVRTWTASDFANANAYAEGLVNDPRWELLGADQRTILRDVFSASKSAGKVWQVYGSSVVVSDQILAGDMYKLMESHPNEATQIKGLLDALYPSGGGTYFRAMYIFGLMKQGWNPDSWTGFKHERAMLYDLLDQHTNNAVVLSGDVHDFWAHQMYRDGSETSPVGINLVAGGVTANGWGSFVGNALSGLGDQRYNYFEEACMLTDPGLKYAGVKDKGFWVIKANATHHVAEAIMINTDDLSPTPTNSALSLSPITDGVLAPYYCDVSLVTTAGQRGSLVKQSSCEIEILAPSSRRRTASTPAKAHPKATVCDCLLEEKIGTACKCA